MRFIVGTLLAWLATTASPAWAACTAPACTKVIDNGPDAGKRVLVVLGDGYAAADQGTYNGAVDSMVVQGLFGNDFFRDHQNALNVYRLNLVSVQSGVSQKVYDEQGTPTDGSDDTVVSTTMKNTALKIIYSGPLLAGVLSADRGPPAECPQRLCSQRGLRADHSERRQRGWMRWRRPPARDERRLVVGSGPRGRSWYRRAAGRVCRRRPQHGRAHQQPQLFYRAGRRYRFLEPLHRSGHARTHYICARYGQQPDGRAVRGMRNQGHRDLPARAQLPHAGLYANTLASGWQMGNHDQHFVGDIDGDLKDVWNGTDWPYAYLELTKSTGTALNFVNRYDNNSGSGSGNVPGWTLTKGDRLFPSDANKDGRTDLFIYNTGNWSTEYLGTLMSGGSSLTGSSSGDWVGGWNLGAVDKILAANYEGGPGKADIFIRNNQWFGLLRRAAAGFVLDRIYYHWIYTPLYDSKPWSDSLP